MENRSVVITFEEAKEMLESDNEIFKQIAINAYPELTGYPENWEQLCEIKKHDKGYCLSDTNRISQTIFYPESLYNTTVSNIERIENILLLQQLLEIRDYWNKSDDFIPNWKDDKQTKHVIRNTIANLEISSFQTIYYIFAFKSRETAEKFLVTFKKDLLKVLSI